MQRSTPRRTAPFLFPLLVAVVLCSLHAYAADEAGYTIRTDANEVRLAFAASDRQGHTITSLRPSDVAVADNGAIIRHFRSFRPASDSPLQLVILLDASGSVASQITAEIAEVKEFVAESTWGERDSVSILWFGGSGPVLLCARNCNGEAAQVKLSTLRANGATPLYDALLQAAEILEQTLDSESRRAMILFSDGVDTISMHSASDALLAAQNLQTAIYSVNSRSQTSSPDKGDTMLDYLAGSTGGLSFRPGQTNTQVLRTILNDLHSGYVLTYEMPRQTTGEHSVRILPTSDPRLQFRSRQGYGKRGDE